MTDREQRQLTPDSVLANGSNSGVKFVLSENIISEKVSTLIRNL